MFITDSGRVKAQAEGYLGRLVGGEVTVTHASLGLFDGLRVEGVKVRVLDDDAQPVDDVVFTARSVTIDYDLLSLLSGDLSAARVVATDPHVRVVEDVTNGTWNVQGLGMLSRKSVGGKAFRPPEQLPELLLRNAQVDYVKRAGDMILARGGVGMEAQFKPLPADDLGRVEYGFEVQTRRLSDASGAGDLGPRLEGALRLGDAGGLAEQAIEVSAAVRNIDFSQLIDLLPQAAADLARRHGVAGRIEVPQIHYAFDPSLPAGRRTGLRLRVVLRDGEILGLPAEWLPAEEVFARQWVMNGIARLAEDADWLPASWRSQARQTARAMQLQPVRLQQVDGDFTFTDAGLTVSGLTGSIEGNRVRINGVVDGYDRDAAMSFVVSDAGGRGLEVPAVLPYLTSLPRPVREIYERFRPAGRCRLRLEFHRGPAGLGPQGQMLSARPTITGQVDVLGGSFELDRLPYRMHNARGRLVLSQGFDPETAQPFDRLTIANLTGRGDPGGPNAGARITVNGSVAPLNSVAGFDVTVVGRNVRYEPSLVAALPEPARKAIETFDPFAFAAEPKSLPALDFRGDFVARVNRPPGVDRRWDFAVDLDLAELAGAPSFFAYPLERAKAKVQVRPDHAIVESISMPLASGAQPGSMVTASGRLDWGRRAEDAPDTPPPLRYDIMLQAGDVAATPTLRAALPPVVNEALQSLGIDGHAAVAARFWRDETGPKWDVSLEMREARFWPSGDTFSLGDVHGLVRVTPNQIELTNFGGQRGTGTIAATGTIGIDTDGRSDLQLTIADLPLEGDVYQLLPTAAQEAWDWLRPEGSVDADVSLSLPTSVFTSRDAQEPVTVATDEIQYAIALRPDGVTATPAALPYPLQDLRGEIRIDLKRVELVDLTASHAIEGRDTPATLRVSGVGDLTDPQAPAGTWDLRLGGADLPVDAELLAALPEGLSALMTSLSLTGDLAIDLDVLRIKTKPAADDAAEAPPPDVGFRGTVTATAASLDIGVPMSDVTGTIKLAGTYEKGELYELSGSVAVDKFKASEREGGTLTADFLLPPGEQRLAIKEVVAQIAGGVLDGRADLVFGEESTGFTVMANVRDLDVKKLVGEDEIGDGRLTAALRLKGLVGEPASREGSGSVLVAGRKLMKLPLVLGLLQVTNLALPIAEPFSEAEVQFDIAGSVLHFRKLEARTLDAGTGQMKLSGTGTLDYDTGNILMTFDTSNRGWDAIPLVGGLVGLARNELVGVQVSGTLKKPEVSGRSLPTVIGTFDRVMGNE